MSALVTTTKNEIPALTKTDVNLFLFADNFAIFPLSQQRLQQTINVRETYCGDWSLEVDIKKELKPLYSIKQDHS